MSDQEFSRENVQLSINNYQEIVDHGDRLERLKQNDDFKAIITEGYLKKEAQNLALLSADPRFSKEEQAECIEAIKGLSHFNTYLVSIRQKAKDAQRQIDVGREMLSEMDAEESSNDALEA